MHLSNADHDIIGSSLKLKAALRHMKIAALAECAVLLQGETGTAKNSSQERSTSAAPEVPARFSRSTALQFPADLWRELFGHEKGAFTGAITQTHGRFELAQCGTLFLDEIGDLPLELQPKLLRVLQGSEFKRLGSAKTIRVDVLVIAATHQNFPRMVEERRYWADLFYRLNVFPTSIPAVRERAEDLVLLVRHFVEYYATLRRKAIHRISDEFMQLLRAYHWPGNIRELQNVVERAVLLSEYGTLFPPHGFPYSSPAVSSTPLRTLAEAERRHIVQTLRHTKWKLSGNSGAAAVLGISRPTFLTKMQKRGIAKQAQRY